MLNLTQYKHNLKSNKVLHIMAVLFLNDVHHVCISHVETQCTKQLFIAVSQKQRLPSQRHLFCFVLFGFYSSLIMGMDSK